MKRRLPEEVGYPPRSGDPAADRVVAAHWPTRHGRQLLSMTDCEPYLLDDLVARILSWLDLYPVGSGVVDLGEDTACDHLILTRGALAMVLHDVWAGVVEGATVHYIDVVPKETDRIRWTLVVERP